MKILVANLGSTSLKYRLFDFSGGQERMVTRGGVERVTDHAQAIESCLAGLRQGGWITKESDLAAVGFKTIMARGVNGCVRLDESVVRAMEEYNTVAPAHNPPYITGIRLFAKRMPGVPLVGLFETAFYQWAPEAAMRYAVPETWRQAGVRRWGFHGASHKFIAERSAELLGREDVAQRARQLYVDWRQKSRSRAALRVISCHLGGSSSVTGIRNGVAIGNSMGLSPQSGLPQNNRVGDLDAFAVPYHALAGHDSLEEAERLLCKESGLKALVRRLTTTSATSWRGPRQGNARAQLALDVFIASAPAIGSAPFICNSTAWTRWSSPPASAKTRPNCAGHLPRSRSIRHRAGRQTQRGSPRREAVSAPESRRQNHGHSHQRRTGRRPGGAPLFANPLTL
jgi:acetate kinase